MLLGWCGSSAYGGLCAVTNRRVPYYNFSIGLEDGTGGLDYLSKGYKVDSYFVIKIGKQFMSAINAYRNPDNTAQKAYVNLVNYTDSLTEGFMINTNNYIEDFYANLPKVERMSEQFMLGIITNVNLNINPNAVNTFVNDEQNCDRAITINISENMNKHGITTENILTKMYRPDNTQKGTVVAIGNFKETYFKTKQTEIGTVLKSDVYWQSGIDGFYTK